MTGRGWIVICMARPVPSNVDFYEHSSIEDAMKEAERLAVKTGEQFVIYEPITRCRRTPPVTFTGIRGEIEALEMAANNDLPF